MMNVFLALFFEFFKTGLFAVGGGLATLPFLYNIAEKYTWLDVANMSDMIAVSDSTPGPIGVNMATYCGYNAGYAVGGVASGIAGGLVATLALVLPSVIVIIIIARVLDKFKNSTLVDNAFKGLRPAVCGLIASAALSVFLSACFNIDAFDKTSDIASVFNIKALILFAIIFVFTRKVKLHPIFVIIPSAIAGILLKM